MGCWGLLGCGCVPPPDWKRKEKKGMMTKTVFLLSLYLYTLWAALCSVLGGTTPVMPGCSSGRSILWAADTAAPSTPSPNPRAPCHNPGLCSLKALRSLRQGLVLRSHRPIPSMGTPPRLQRPPPPEEQMEPWRTLCCLRARRVPSVSPRPALPLCDFSSSPPVSSPRVFVTLRKHLTLTFKSWGGGVCSFWGVGFSTFFFFFSF